MRHIIIASDFGNAAVAAKMRKLERGQWTYAYDIESVMGLQPSTSLNVIIDASWEQSNMAQDIIRYLRRSPAWRLELDSRM
jgi:hypothetical protein